MSKAEKEQMLEDARAYNKEMLGNIDLIDPFSQEDVEIVFLSEDLYVLSELYVYFLHLQEEMYPRNVRHLPVAQLHLFHDRLEVLH